MDVSTLPWSLPGSRLFGLLTPDGLALHSAEYEMKAADSRIVSGLTVSSVDDGARLTAHVRPGVISWDDGRITLAFIGSRAWRLENRSDRTVTATCHIHGDPHGQAVFALHLPGTQQLQLLATGAAMQIGKVLARLDLAPGSSVDLVVHPVSADATAIDAVAYSRTCWEQWMRACPTVAPWIQDAVNLAWYCLGANLIELRWPPVAGRRLIVPSVLGYVGIWQWDAYFIALGLRHGDSELARQQIDAVLGFPSEDGQLQDVLHDGGRLAGFSDLPAQEFDAYVRATGMPAKVLAGIPITKPPLAAWAVERLANGAGGDAWIATLWDVLVDQREWWWRTALASPHGLPCYQHPFSSGLDDSPSFDEPGPSTPPDLIAYLWLQESVMERLAWRIGRPWDRELSAERTATLRRTLESSWDSSGGYLRTLGVDGPLAAETVQCLMPLLGGLTPAGAQPLLAALQDPARFGGQLAVPTVARRDPTHDPDRMWRGPIWANTNLLVVEGLLAIGEEESARALALKTLRLIAKHDGPYEYYRSDDGTPASTAVPCFSWTAAVCIDLAVRFADAGQSASSKDELS